MDAIGLERNGAKKWFAAAEVYARKAIADLFCASRGHGPGAGRMMDQAYRKRRILAACDVIAKWRKAASFTQTHSPGASGLFCLNVRVRLAEKLLRQLP